MAQDNVFVQDPQAVLDYKFDFRALTNGAALAISDYLDADETLTSFTIVAETGITVVSSSLTTNSSCVQVWLTGGTAPTTYRVTAQVVTSKFRTDERTISIRVRNL